MGRRPTPKAALSDDGRLSDQHAMFCREYAVDMDATEAAFRAGVTRRSAKYRARDWMKLPQVREEIGRLLSAKAEAVDLKAEEVARKLLALAAKAETAGDYSAARACLVDYGKHIGMWPRGVAWTANLPPFDQMTEAQLEHLAKGGDPAQLPRP